MRQGSLGSLRILSGVARLIANHRSSSSSKSYQKSGPFPPPTLPGLNGTMALSGSRPLRAAIRGDVEAATSPAMGLPQLPRPPSRRAVPNTQWIGTDACVGCFPIPPGLPRADRRVGVHDFTFEACSGFTHVTARGVAHPPYVGIITRFRSRRLPDKTA